jgi:NDP-sugar pyrophosphorylase family protein
MQAVILAAGRGVRMGHLTEPLPKPLLLVSGKSLLERKMEVLPDSIDEVVIVIGYKGDLIRAQYGSVYNGKRIRYVEQDVLDGSAGALWRCKDILNDRFIVLMGDDVYAAEDIGRAAEYPGWAMGVFKQESILQGGRIVLDEQEVVQGIEAQSAMTQGGGYANTGLYALDTRLFSYEPVALAANPKEFGLPQTMLAASSASSIPVQALFATYWEQVTAQEDIRRLEAEMY